MLCREGEGRKLSSFINYYGGIPKWINRIVTRILV